VCAVSTGAAPRAVEESGKKEKRKERKKITANLHDLLQGRQHLSAHFARTVVQLQVRLGVNGRV
jgi:hypothetical protein